MSSLSYSNTTTLADLQDLVVRIGRKAPHLSERAACAGLLLVAGKVRAVRPNVFEVEGSHGARYTVDAVGFTCDCPDFQHGAPEHHGARYCKHLIAGLMLRRLAEKAVAREERRRSRLVPFRPERPARRLVRVSLVGRLAV